MERTVRPLGGKRGGAKNGNNCTASGPQTRPGRPARPARDRPCAQAGDWSTWRGESVAIIVLSTLALHPDAPGGLPGGRTMLYTRSYGQAFHTEGGWETWTQDDGSEHLQVGDLHILLRRPDPPPRVVEVPFEFDDQALGTWPGAHPQSLAGAHPQSLAGCASPVSCRCASPVSCRCASPVSCRCASPVSCRCASPVSCRCASPVSCRCASPVSCRCASPVSCRCASPVSCRCASPVSCRCASPGSGPRESWSRPGAGSLAHAVPGTGRNRHRRGRPAERQSA